VEAVLEWALLGITLVGILYLAIAKPQGLIVLLALATALEISSTVYPSVELLTKAMGLITLARLTTFALIFAGLIHLFKREKREKFLEVLKTPLTWALALYIVLCFASSLYSIDASKSVVEALRLLILFLAYLSIAIVGEIKTIKATLWAVYLMGLALAPLAFYEAVTKNFIWQKHLATVEAAARVNATFVDPNIFARYLVLAAIVNMLFLLMTEEILPRIFYGFTLLILFGELAVTLSRGGILTLAVVLLVMAVLLKSRKVLISLGVLGVGSGIYIALRPSTWQRFSVFRVGVAALDQTRQYLISAGLAMFRDHPLKGIGLGGFEKALRSDYYSYYALPGEGATLSHTTLVTILAELGILGLLALVGVWLAIFRLLYHIYYLGREYYIIGTAYFLWIVAVFISSQAEGRFFEDPMIWLSMGILVVLSKLQYQDRYQDRF
jgi:putative inorganic carbon (hco3(-)) transporter